MISLFYRFYPFVLLVYCCSTTLLFGKGASLSELELAKIVTRQEKLLKDGKNWTETALTTEAQEIVTCYENFLLDNPSDLNGYLLFGKFLAQTGQAEGALELFLQADRINPNIAVTKQYIGNFLVENGKPLEAFPFLLMTTRLAPTEPVYHYDLGNFIFLFKEQLEGIEDHNKLSILMHECFKEAAALNPKNFDYHLRFAQSFFDFNNSMHNEAIAAWDVLLNEFGKRTKDEIDYIKISKARLLLDMNKKDEALSILKTIQSKVIQKEKNALIKKARGIDGGSSNKNSFNSLSYPSSSKLHLSYTFPLDPHILRMKQVTLKLFQENMLNDLKRDVTQARILENGSLSLELSSKQK